MPNFLSRNKHYRFKMRSTKELPTREFTVEFTKGYMELKKLGSGHGRWRLRWEPLVGAMLTYGTPEPGEDLTDYRDFLVEIRAANFKPVTFQVWFGKKGVGIKDVQKEAIEFWKWRDLLNFAITRG